MEIDFIVSSIDVDQEAVELFWGHRLERGQFADLRVGNTGREGCLGDSHVWAGGASEERDNEFSVKCGPFLVSHAHALFFIGSVPNSIDLLTRETVVLAENLDELFAGMLTVFDTLPSRKDLGESFGGVKFEVLLRLDNQLV